MHSARQRRPISQHDLDTIRMIANRACSFWPERSQSDFFMDLTAAMMGGCSLRLDDLLRADDHNFVHDIGGIMQHLNRITYELTDCFVPRYAEPSDPSVERWDY